MTLSLALIGAGRIGRVHAEAIAATPGARLVAVASRNEAPAREIAQAQGARLCTLEEIEADPTIDAVVICTPTDTHAALIIRFAWAGKAIFCEKPVDLSLDRVRDCLDAVEATGVPLMVGFNRRFDPHFAAARAAIDAGRIGRVEMLTITSRDPHAPPPDFIPSSGGILKDLSIHDFDMARFILAEEPRTIYASGAALFDRDIAAHGDHDSVSILLTTASGRQCSISNSRRAAYGYDQRLEVLGSLGALQVENQRPVSVEIATAEGFTRPPLHDFFMSRYAAAYAAEIAAFIAALESGQPPKPDGRDGFMALAIAEAAEISLRDRRVVDLSEVL